MIARAWSWVRYVGRYRPCWSLAVLNGVTGVMFDGVAALLVMYAFLVPISVGMGMRVFPVNCRNAPNAPATRVVRLLDSDRDLPGSQPAHSTLAYNRRVPPHLATLGTGRVWG
jgi:hypothetical protein